MSVAGKLNISAIVVSIVCVKNALRGLKIMYDYIFEEHNVCKKCGLCVDCDLCKCKKVKE